MELVVGSTPLSSRLSWVESSTPLSSMELVVASTPLSSTVLTGAAASTPLSLMELVVMSTPLSSTVVFVAGVTTVVMRGCGLLLCTAAYAGTPKPMTVAPTVVQISDFFMIVSSCVGCYRRHAHT